MRRQQVVRRMLKESEVLQEAVEKQPLKTMQICVSRMHHMVRHDEHFGPTYLDGLRQIQRDLDDLIHRASGYPPETTRRSALLRKMAEQLTDPASRKLMIENAEKLERQAAGLKSKFIKQRGQEAEKSVV